MYRTRPHRRDGVEIDDLTGQIRLLDCATNPGVLSKAYTYQEVENICEVISDMLASAYSVTCKIDDKTVDHVFLCYLHKVPNAVDVFRGEQ